MGQVWGLKMKIIEKSYIAKLVDAISLLTQMSYENNNWRMKKYLNLTGLFLLMRDSQKDIRYLTWFPYINGDICYTKGIISTKIDKLTIEDSNIQIQTQHSLYRLDIVDENAPQNLIKEMPKIW